ncbi:amyloid protein-binding protein 2-like isoform X1 [Rhagoletis pomonella]|uniref:amyloid protein-binding protein 2-like isoform X1 n=2 Tax=Rhagoletis pomonella TaxID=28610 RepID=UPI00177B9CD4|nr:amyloid protein-binding protein 2-like isoform X1 [Rhagoletis pomonella]XP_036341716.1 amyloid protein-binding protein 2-like isoform X1 [Rhagoletis pomonella]
MVEIAQDFTKGKTPATLYEQCLGCYVAKLNYNVQTLDSVQQLRYLPPGVLSDVYVMMSKHDELKDMLLEQLIDLSTFERLLRFDPVRLKLFRCLTALMSSGKLLSTQLQQNFTMRYRQKQDSTKFNKTATTEPSSSSNPLKKSPNLPTTPTMVDLFANASISTTVKDNDVYENSSVKTESSVVNDIDPDAIFEELPLDDFHFGLDVIDFGLRLGSFLSEAGWLADSVEILQCVASKLRNMPADKQHMLVRLDCLQRLLHSQSTLYSFKSAERTFDETVALLKELSQDNVPRALLAKIYTQFSAMYFARSEYDNSHMWSSIAMRHLEESTPERIAVDVLRQGAKACVVKRDFQRANLLISQATYRARKTFGAQHQKYADSLLDYGFFLLNVDSVYQSVIVYKDALDIRRNIFGNRNFHVAIAHEDLSYAYYVHEYSTGNFSCARKHVEKAIEIMEYLVPRNHLVLASAKRVKALLLEEIALDKLTDGGADEDGLLRQSEELHNFALKLSLEMFGEVNVQTAKHYGNLGRLYQTMNRFEEAERMHLKAIQIKTDLLGAYDYEVGLSIGHLASLYNYHMGKYREAESLYMRSIEISLRLFGKSYSGLEYDYLGLCHVYETRREFEKYLKYAIILENWQMLRGQNIAMNKTYAEASDDYSLEEVKYQFFNMCTQNSTATATTDTGTIVDN